MAKEELSQAGDGAVAGDNQRDWRRDGVGRREGVIPNPKARLLDQVVEVMRLRHYSLRTERSYGDWIRRYVKFHRMKTREELEPAEAKVEVFLSDLAVNGHVAASTQNQAFNALLFLYREVLHRPLGNIQAVRADRPVRVPGVLTAEEARQVILVMSGPVQLVVKLLYGSGLRLMEALRLRVQDLDFGMKQLTVRDGKGSKDRYTVLPDAVVPALQEHLQRVRAIHEADLRQGYPHDPGVARARGCVHDHDLHSRPSPGRVGGEKSAGWVRGSEKLRVGS
jgi:site-specific recombinase XerD